MCGLSLYGLCQNVQFVIVSLFFIFVLSISSKDVLIKAAFKFEICFGFSKFLFKIMLLKNET